MTEEKINATWFRTTYYYRNDGYFLPIAGEKVEMYEPFDISSENHRIYIDFLNLKVEKEELIEDFYNQYGPLGLMKRKYDLIDVDSDDPAYQGDILVFRSEDWHDMLDQVAQKYSFDAWQILKKYNSDKTIPTLLEIQVVAGEKAEEFKHEHAKFLTIVKLIMNIQDRDSDAIISNLEELKSLIEKGTKKRPNWPRIKGEIEEINVATEHEEHWLKNEKDEKVILERAMEELTQYLNEKIAFKYWMKIAHDSTSGKFSKELHLKSKSLLDSMYLMLVNDIADGKTIKRCEHCGKYFLDSRMNVKYCGSSCQNKAKTKRYQDNIQETKQLYKEQNMKPEEIAAKLGRKVELIKKWIDLGENRELDTEDN